MFRKLQLDTNHQALCCEWLFVVCCLKTCYKFCVHLQFCGLYQVFAAADHSAPLCMLDNLFRIIISSLPPRSTLCIFINRVRYIIIVSQNTYHYQKVVYSDSIKEIGIRCLLDERWMEETSYSKLQEQTLPSSRWWKLENSCETGVVALDTFCAAVSSLSS